MAVNVFEVAVLLSELVVIYLGATGRIDSAVMVGMLALGLTFFALVYDIKRSGMVPW